MATYRVVSTVAIPADEDDYRLAIEIGDTINRIEWDGETPFAPPTNTELVLE